MDRKMYWKLKHVDRKMYKESHLFDQINNMWIEKCTKNLSDQINNCMYKESNIFDQINNMWIEKKYK